MPQLSRARRTGLARTAHLWAWTLLSPLGAGCAIAAPAPCSLTVRWAEEPPYLSRSQDGRVVGVDADTVEEALKRLGCRVRWVQMPWGRALAELEAGRLDMLTGAAQTPERARFALFSAPGPVTVNALYVNQAKRAAWAFNTLADLRGSGFRLGAEIGSVYGAEFDELSRDPAFARITYRVASRRSLWLMLKADRIDGLFAEPNVAAAELAALGLEGDIVRTSLTLTPGGAYDAFSRRSVSPDFVARYNQVMTAMRQDGSLAAIRHRYGVKP